MVVGVVVPCVLYAAKSNEDVHGSLTTQLDDCRRGVADAGDRDIVAEFCDEAVSAFKRSRGPGLAETLRERRRWRLSMVRRSCGCSTVIALLVVMVAWRGIWWRSRCGR